MPWDSACGRNWLRGKRFPLTARKKSAKGIVGARQAKLLGALQAERRSNRQAEPQRLTLKARTVPREGIKGEGKSFVEEWRYCICRARAFMG